jgi:hypothetical protein
MPQQAYSHSILTHEIIPGAKNASGIIVSYRLDKLHPQKNIAKINYIIWLIIKETVYLCKKILTRLQLQT